MFTNIGSMALLFFFFVLNVPQGFALVLIIISVNFLPASMFLKLINQYSHVFFPRIWCGVGCRGTPFSIVELHFWLPHFRMEYLQPKSLLRLNGGCCPAQVGCTQSAAT